MRHSETTRFSRKISWKAWKFLSLRNHAPSQIWTNKQPALNDEKRKTSSRQSGKQFLVGLIIGPDIFKVSYQSRCSFSLVIDPCPDGKDGYFFFESLIFCLLRNSISRDVFEAERKKVSNSVFGLAQFQQRRFWILWRSREEGIAAITLLTLR